MATSDNNSNNENSSNDKSYSEKYQKYLKNLDREKQREEKLNKWKRKDDGRDPRTNTSSSSGSGPSGPIRPNTNNGQPNSGPGNQGRRRTYNPIATSKDSSIVYLEPVKYNAANGKNSTAVVTAMTVTKSNGDVKNVGLQVQITKTGAFTGISTSFKAQLSRRHPYYDVENNKWCHTDDMGHWIVKETIASNYIKVASVNANTITLEITEQNDLSSVGSMMSKWTDDTIEDGEKECLFLYILPLNYLLVRKKKSSIMEYFHDQDRTGVNKDIMFIREGNCCGQQFAPTQWAFKEGSEAAQWYGTTAVTELVNTTSAWTNYGIYHNIIPTLDEIFENDN